MNQPSTEPPALRILRITWKSAARRDATGVVWVAPGFVAEQGQLVRILDVRSREELSGALGHVPAVTHVPMTELANVVRVLDPATYVVLVSSTGERAGIAARYLESLGMLHVAAMTGGMQAWKAQGFTSVRDDDSVRSKLVALDPGVGRDGRALLGEPTERLTAEQIRVHLGDVAAIRWVKLAAFLMQGKCSCVDGRDDHGVIGTPGGDAGELLLALAASERVRGRTWTREGVRALLVRHLDTFGQFYMHSDTHAMNRLIMEGLRKDDRVTPHLGGVFEPEQWRTFLKRPPAAVRGPLLEHLVRSENMGCGHLRFAMSDPVYGVRSELAVWFLSAFHELRWEGAPELEWVVLGGDHSEGAVLGVTLEEELHGFTRIPLVSPMVAGKQVFVNHPQVTTFMRREMAAHLVQADGCPSTLTSELLAEIERLGAQQLGATLSRLAKGLPVFEVAFSGGVPRSVREVGTVS
jgi:rhodanese-related sulfurtransferase